jgi:hypothetical protein
MSTVKVQGFGCMGFSAFYSSAKSTTPEQARMGNEQFITILLHVCLFIFSYKPQF